SEKSIDRLINIIDDLDEISRLESGVLNLNLRRFDIVSLARDIVESLSYEATERHITISLGNEPTEPQPPVTVKADRRYIDQVINNLVVNSVRYGREGGHTRISFIDLFDRVMIEVADDGMGIDKADLPRIFERFYRVDKSRSREQGGTGLGLAIVKHIIEAHHEGITVRSELGKGTTFSFTLSKN
ncbi:MAG: sensor histidine kinase, partial [Tidjanibacter sp.]|nr:sensor histidine kinase [Tidjanibacter sp.]